MVTLMKSGMTISEKIISKVAGKRSVPGEIVYVSPDVQVTHDNDLRKVLDDFEKLGIERIKEPNKIIVVFDHRVPAESLLFAKQHKRIREFVKKQGIKHFYDVGRSGISHQITAEKGHVRPGILYSNSDAQAPTSGAFGAVAVGKLDLLEILATGKTWLKIPESMKFIIKGDFRRGVTSRDLMQWILGDIGPSGASYKVVEFVGPTIDTMTIDSRMTLCNMTVHADAKTGIINPDERTINYVKNRTDVPFKPLYSDREAEYVEEFNYDVSELEPLLAVPPNPCNTRAVTDMAGIEIDQAFIGSCAGGRLEDLRIAAKILKNRKIHPRVRMIVIPISQEIYSNALKEGLIDIFIQANVAVGTPTCGPCGGRHMGVLAAGENCICTSTVNFDGRMGSSKAKIYLANPATVAVSALKGEITYSSKVIE